MVAYNVSRTARGAQYAMEDYGNEAEAIRSGLDPMLRDIEVQSGMRSGANVLQNQLFTGGDKASTMAAYYEALASKLPGYVNARRAYETAEKKKAASGAGGGGAGMMMPVGNYPMQNLLPPQYYLPMTSTDVRGKTGPAYVTSPYGAMPQRVVTPTQPATRTLAQRRYSRNKMAEM